ncbi:MAG: HAD-IIB family hydrolase, partial [Desulfuromonadales bacterium]|nr:HAD-IIB family hydrolase [Desulfuromonadales bacterium]
MIALDLDGTLALENHTVSPATRSALTELSLEGIEVVIATGRRYRTTRFVIDDLGLEVYAVCLGGALGKRPDTSTFH